MNGLTDLWVVPWLAFLADWSVRWGLVLAALSLWFALRPPRRAATRHLLCAVALAAGMLLPIVPRWRIATVSWPSRGAGVAAQRVTPPPYGRAEPLTTDISTEHDARDAARTSVVVARPVSGEPDVVGSRDRLGQVVLGSWRLAVLGLGALWVTAVIVLAARLLGGRLLLAKLRAHAVPGGEASDRLLDECRRALRLSRPVALAAHPAVASPVAIGGRRALVLVPPDWDGWPESHRRDCLLHELTHLARYDDWAKLVQELVRVPFFFHPLVRWLLNRLDRERELLCDEAVVALGADPLGYARLLLSLARRPGRLLPAATVLRPGWLPFFERGTVAVRNKRLLEDDMTRSLSPPSVRRPFALGTVAFAAALGIGGLHIRAVEPQAKKDDRPTHPAVKAEPAAATARNIEGVILDPDGKPAAGAVVVAGFYGSGKPNHQVLTTGKDGRFTWPIPEGPVSVYFVAHKEGLAPAIWASWLPVEKRGDHVERKLGKQEPFSAMLIDDARRPVARARVRIEMFGHSSASSRDGSGRSTISTSFSHVRREVVSGSPLEGLFETTTDGNGSFTLRASRPDTWLKLGVSAAGGGQMRVRAEKEAQGRVRSIMADLGFVAAPPGEPTRLVAFPAARLAGRVATTISSVSVAGLKVSFQPSHPPGRNRYRENLGAETVLTGEDGQFVIDGLSEGTVNVFVHGTGEGETWTYRAAQDVALKPGETVEVVFELIRGVDVEGKVLVYGAGTPLEGAQVGVYGPYRPRTGAMTQGAKTDAQGRYHYRLPPGETYLYVMGPPAGYTRLAENVSSRTVTIPDGVARYEVPPLEVAAAVTVRGRVLDSTGSPVVGATVVGVCKGSVCVPLPGSETLTDAQGAFRLPTGWNNTVPIGQAATLLIRLRDGAEHEAVAVPAGDGAVTIKLAIVGAKPSGVDSPRQVAPDELAGVVVDTQRKPIEGVEAHAWHWVPGHVTRTDRDGRFRFAKMTKDDKVEVRFRKDGYETQFHLDKVVGRPGWVVVLGNTTFFEGRVLAPDGSPGAGASIRADSGPRRASGFRLSECYTETRSGKDGRYRLYVEPGQYDIEIRSPGVGVARLPKEAIAADQVRERDIRLAPGIRFVARTVDSETGKPVAGVVLSHWQKPGIEGTSDAVGRIEVRDVPPGKYPRFHVKADGYTRWWSDACLSEWSRYQKDARHGFQRNFDGLDFEVAQGMDVVTITLERGATVRGRVIDPDGKPVAGATVAPALTGTGNSLTGDTRFSVETDAEGKFTMLLPASGDREYNLVAHDGKYGQWRTWANGVLLPFRSKPREEISDVTLRLTRPATVRGRVTDAQGKPVAGREVRASAADRRENRYYDPTTKTRDDGTYELKYVRPGEQFIQVAPFWLDAAQSPEGSSQTLSLAPGKSRDGVDFRIQRRSGEN
ncbi:MAG: carboxypeptidase regulatory-like domain-containing protein [Isosphaerales bacterium]